MEDEIMNDSLQEIRSRYPAIVVEDTRIPTLHYDENEPRLIISEINILNFKSYGGERKLGPFHKNFTCIIGPNGSGKSNVIDALLFVFGFKASKIRSKKLSVLIHKSELFPNVQSCTVEVHFKKIIPTGEEDEDYTVIENSQFVVSRTAFKDNSSVFKINDKKASTKEVADFLRKQGIDLDHNRFLILQGEVEQISLMKPKATTEYDDGLLEYLEDIIGSNRFKDPISILFKRLEELCDLRMEKLNRVKIVEKEKKDLEGVRNDALRYLRLCNEIAVRKNISFQLKCHELREIEKTALGNVEECKNEMKVIMDNIAKVSELKLAKEKAVKSVVEQHLLKMQEYEKSKKLFKDLENEDSELRDNRKHTKKKIEEIKKSIKEKEKDLEKYENVPEESEVRISDLKKEIADLDNIKLRENNNLEKAKGELIVEIEDIQKKKDVKVSELMNEEGLLTIQGNKVGSLKIERDELRTNLTKEEQKLERLEEELKITKETVKAGKENVEKLSIDLPKMEKEYASLLSELETSKKNHQILEAEMSEIKQQLDAKSSSETEHKAIKFLREQQAAGRLKNVIDRLGELAYVEPKYDVPLSTACGRLDSIVTEKIDDAQKCVELMKRNNIQRSSFIGMDKVAHWANRCGPIQTPMNTPRAFDLLHLSHERFRAVFYFSMMDLLVCVDINTGRRINSGKRKFRIVTFAGQLIEISGAMTGGGNRVIKGKIRTSSDKRLSSSQTNFNRRDLEQKYEEKEVKLNQLTGRIDQLSNLIDGLSRNIYDAKRKYEESKTEVEPLPAKEANLLQAIETAKRVIQNTQIDSVRISNMDKMLNQLEKAYEKDKSKVENIRKEVDKLKAEIENTKIAKYSSITSRIESVEKKIKEKADTLKKINKSVTEAAKIVTRTRNALEQLTKDKLNLENKIIEMDKTLHELDERASINVKEYEKTNHDVEELAKVKVRMEEELSKETEEYKILDHNRKQSQRSLDAMQEKLNQITWNINQVKDNIAKLTIFHIPEECEPDDDDNEPFVDIIGRSNEAMILYSSQPGSHVGQVLKTYTDEELANFQPNRIGYQDLEEKMAKEKPNLTAIEEYRLKEEIYMQRAMELSEVTKIRDSQRQQMDQLKKQRLEEFLAGFNLITGKLKEMYQLITMGGDAELELVDTLDPFSEGIVFSVRPPKKSWKNISNLSGGEKTLSSLALVFALHHFKPTAFYFMDEIDAALDFKNVSIVANYIKGRTRNAQFIIISLRNNMYELADRLVGIYKPFNFSKTCVLNPKPLERRLLAAHGIAPSPQPEKRLPLETVPLVVPAVESAEEDRALGDIPS